MAPAAWLNEFQASERDMPPDTVIHHFDLELRRGACPGSAGQEQSSYGRKYPLQCGQERPPVHP